MKALPWELVDQFIWFPCARPHLKTRAVCLGCAGCSWSLWAGWVTWQGCRRTCSGAAQCFLLKRTWWLFTWEVLVPVPYRSVPLSRGSWCAPAGICGWNPLSLPWLWSAAKHWQHTKEITPFPIPSSAAVTVLGTPASCQNNCWEG